MNPIDRLLTFPHPDDKALEYVVLQAGEKIMWYLLDTIDEVWYYLHPPTHPDNY